MNDDRVRAEALEVKVHQLTEGLERRDRIEHAVGILMMALACNEKVAFDSLAYVSSVTNRKIRDLAGIIAGQVAHGDGLPPDVSIALERVLGRKLRPNPYL